MPFCFDDSTFSGPSLQKYQDMQSFQDEVIFLINNRMLIPNA